MLIMTMVEKRREGKDDGIHQRGMRGGATLSQWMTQQLTINWGGDGTIMQQYLPF
jgi:hypothetical protein